MVCPAVVVNHELMASSSVLVAGDAAHFPCQTLGRMTVRSVDHAYHAGYVAGKAFTYQDRRVEGATLLFTLCALPCVCRAESSGEGDAVYLHAHLLWRDPPIGSEGELSSALSVGGRKYTRVR